MRKFLVVVTVAALFAACNSVTPTGPSTVTIETPTPTTTTTSIPPGVTTTIGTSTTTTSIPSPATTRIYVAFGVVPPSVPSQLTLFLQPLAGRTVSSLLGRLPFIGTEADPLQWTVTGFYTTAGGGRGQVSGQLTGTLDDGNFGGTLTSETPECVAEREFGGSLDPQFLRWTGGQTLRDCKGSPLGFNTLLMLATTAPPPTTTAISTSTTTTPLQCGYSLSADGVSVDGAGGVRTVGLTTGPTCTWNVQNFVSWIRVQPLNGSGSATVSLTIEANPGAPRSATVVIAGLPFVVNQGLPTTTTTTTTSILVLADLLPVTPAPTFCRTDGPTLYVDVRNQGAAASVSSFTRVYFDNGFTGATFSDRITPGLTPNTTTTLTFAIPDTCWVSNCTIQIVADASQAVPEGLNESNNTVTATCNFPFGGLSGSRP